MKQRHPEYARGSVGRAVLAVLALSLHLSSAPATTLAQARAEVLYYQGYALLSLNLTPIQNAKQVYAREIEEGWTLIRKAAELGSPKALRATGVYWAEQRDVRKARRFLERAIAAGSVAAKYDLAAMITGMSDNASNELLHAAGKPKDKRAGLLLREAAEGGYPPAVRAWCAQNASSDPRSPIVAQCREWMEIAAAQGDWQAWTLATRWQHKNAPIVAVAYGEGISKVRGNLSSITREGYSLDLPSEHPFERCTSFLSAPTSRFFFVFNEQLCVPPRATFPKWRGLGKGFVEPPSSPEAKALYERGLILLAQQQHREAGGLLKQAAEMGHTGAMINWALVQHTNDPMFYQNILDQSDSLHTAWYWVNKASKLGDLRATYMLTAFIDMGVYEPLRKANNRPVKPVLVASRMVALKQEHQAAEAGLARAQYLHGWQLIRDERAPEGWRWLKKAHDNGERLAGFDLYRIARYIWRDNSQALHYLRRTAQEGELASVQLLADAHANGALGLKPDARLAECYAKVVDQHSQLDWEARQDLALPGVHRQCDEK